MNALVEILNARYARLMQKGAFNTSSFHYVKVYGLHVSTFLDFVIVRLSYVIYSLIESPHKKLVYCDQIASSITNE